MTLSRQQKARLRRQISPLVRDVLKHEVRGGGGRDYTSKILDGSGGRETTGAQPIAQLAIAWAAGDGNLRQALDYAHDRGFGDDVTKALEAGDAAGGGVFVTGAIADGFIDLLRPRSVVRAAGPDVRPNIPGTLEFPKFTGGATATYVGETTQIPTSRPKTGSVSLMARKLGVLVPISNDLIRFGSKSGRTVANDVTADMTRAAGTREDIAFLRGSGSEFEPKGLTNWALPANKFPANGTITPSNVIDDLDALIGKLQDLDVPMERPAWFWHPRTSRFLRTLRDGNDRFIFRDEIEQGRLFGWPWHESTNIPKNLGVGEDESQIILTDMSEVVLGEVDGVTIMTSDAASFTDPDDGQVKSALETDTMLVRLILHNDLIAKHAESVAVLEQVKWGA